ncbi:MULTISPECIES: hypothetical protein [unclassified Microcoleus]|uniref:hypothetical protein n=1 Tax=unclassified Microcoleus TaxID=2642155 RepID=UPI002FD35E14
MNSLLLISVAHAWGFKPILSGKNSGIVGMASPLSRWDLVSDALFLLFLQLEGINSSASLLFPIYRGFTNRFNCTMSQPIIRIQNF